MATGDITATIPNLDGGAVDLLVEGFTTGAAWNVGSGAGNALAAVADAGASLALTGGGFNADGSVNASASYSSRLNAVRRQAYPNDGSEDQAASGSDLAIRFNADMWLWAGYAAVLTTALGLIINAGGASQLSNAAAGIAVTNTSTLAPPKVLGGWDMQTSLNAQRVTGDFTLGFHAYHMTGIACVIFTVTGDTSGHIETVTVAAPVARASARTSLSAEAYEATIATASFTDGESLTINARAYPNVGDAASVLNTADTTGAGNEVLLRSDLSFTYDPSNSLRSFALVDTVSGSDVTGTGGSEPQARVTPYATIAKAIDDGHTDILLAAGSHTLGNPAATIDNPFWIEIRPDDGEDAGTVTAATPAGVAWNYNRARMKLSGLTVALDRWFDGSSDATAEWIWLDNCEVSQTSTTVGLGYRSQACYLTDCGGTFADLDGFSSSRVAYAMDGVSIDGYAESSSLFRSARCRGDIFIETPAASNPAPNPDGCLFVMNALEAADRDGRILQFNDSAWDLDIGLAVIGNTFERHGSGASTSPLVQIYADNNTANATNILFWHNTVVGQRVNFCYNDAGTAIAVRSNISVVGNAMEDGFNIKGDTFGTPSANRVGNLALAHGTGVSDNIGFDTAFPADDPSAAGMRGYHGPGTGNLAGVGSLGFTDDQSLNAGNAGGGDYLPAEGSALLDSVGSPRIAFDLFGTSVGETAAMGAAQPAPATPSGGLRRGGRGRTRRSLLGRL